MLLFLFLCSCVENPFSVHVYVFGVSRKLFDHFFRLTISYSSRSSTSNISVYNGAFERLAENDVCCGVIGSVVDGLFRTDFDTNLSAKANRVTVRKVLSQHLYPRR